MNNSFCIALLVLFASLQTPLSAGIAPGDTLVNFNRLNKGIISIQPGADMDTHYFSVSPEGLLLVRSALPNSEFRFGVKTRQSDWVYFDNEVQLDLTRSPVLIHVTSDQIEMATGLRADGRIWVVVVVAMLVFAGILGYLVVLERRMR
jgi:hypothetical protein